jgi:molybdate transport system substrate-binding protein
MNSRRVCLRAIVSLTALALCPGLPAEAKDSQAAAANVVRVAAAADLRPVLPILAQQFEQQTGIKLQISFASSSALATQIINGAPFDLFLGADFSFPEKVVAANLAVEPAAVPYAKGVLVLWAPKNSPIQPPSVDKLLNPSVTRIAIADENHAPYGRAAYAVLRKMHLLDKLQPKLVVAEDIAQTAQFVQSGNAQAGFISLTLASSPNFRKAGNFSPVPRVYPEIRQCGVVIKNSAHQQQAQQFFTWLLTAKVQESLPKFGLNPTN